MCHIPSHCTTVRTERAKSKDEHFVASTEPLGSISILKKKPVLKTHMPQIPYLRNAGLAALRCKMVLICFSKESGVSARIRSGDSATSASSRVHSRGGDAGWTVLLQNKEVMSTMELVVALQDVISHT